MLWILIALSIFLAATLSSYRPTRIPNADWRSGSASHDRCRHRHPRCRHRHAVATLHCERGDREKHELITHGIYRFLRHPAYTGSLLSFIGLGVRSGTG